MADVDMNGNEYELAWEETFDGDALSFAHWNQESRAPGWVNNELQEYVPGDSNIYIKDGFLHIVPQRKTDADGNVSCTSGRINTRGKHEFTYGRFEARIKVPAGKGYLPAFWLLPDEEKHGNWPVCGEIDIMEILGDRLDTLYASLHYGETHTMQQGSYRFPGAEDPSEDFHVYACEWEPGSIRWFIDGQEYFECQEPEGFEHPFYLILNLAVGGDWPGDPDDETPFGEDAAMLVDYVRVYRRKRYEHRSCRRIRKVLGVCGVWEDAENFNMFIRSVASSELAKDYVVCAFTFGIASNNNLEIKVEEQFASFINKMDMAGLVLFGEMLKSQIIIDSLIKGAKKKDIPVFMLERTNRNCINIKLDYNGGFEEIVRHVVEDHKFTEVDMFAGFRGNKFSDDRIEIYRKVLSDNNIPFEEKRVHYGDFWDAPTIQILSSLIESGYKLPQAFVCANDSMAIGVCDCLHRFGIRVPEDVVVTGFDGIKQSYYHNPGITTSTPDYDGISSAIGKALKRYEDPNEREKLLKEDITIGYKKLIRHSCSCSDENPDKWFEIVADLNSDNHDYFRHILEMGRFISQTISMYDLVEATEDLQHYLWLWEKQYYFIGVRENSESIHAIFEGRNGEYKYDRKFVNMPAALPNMDELLAEDSGINIILFKQAKARTESFGYMACGFEELSMRDEQRFEEFSLFVSAMIHSVMNNRQLRAANTEIERMSESDYLTGLFNRRGFFREVDRVLHKSENQGKWFSIFAADLDGLKQINDNYGHFEGDMAIQSLALALKTFVGNRGFCSRFGGDEFSFVVIGDEPLSGKVEEIREKINVFLENDNGLKGRPYSVGTSLGYAERIIDENIDIEDLMREADLVMYKDKYLRKSGI